LAIFWRDCLYGERKMAILNKNRQKKPVFLIFVNENIYYLWYNEKRDKTLSGLQVRGCRQGLQKMKEDKKVWDTKSASKK
jgi:hypothetical protein